MLLVVWSHMLYTAIYIYYIYTVYCQIFHLEYLINLLACNLKKFMLYIYI